MINTKILRERGAITDWREIDEIVGEIERFQTHIKKMIALIENSHMNTPGAKEWSNEAWKLLSREREQF